VQIKKYYTTDIKHHGVKHALNAHPLLVEFIGHRRCARFTAETSRLRTVNLIARCLRTVLGRPHACRYHITDMDTRARLQRLQDPHQ